MYDKIFWMLGLRIMFGGVGSATIRGMMLGANAS